MASLKSSGLDLHVILIHICGHDKHDINIFINNTWQKYAGDSSKLHGDLNFAFDQRESGVNLHKATSLPESPSNASPADITQSLSLPIS